MADTGKSKEKKTFKQRVVGSLFWVAVVLLDVLVFLLVKALMSGDGVFSGEYHVGRSVFEKFYDSLGLPTDNDKPTVGTVIERLGFAIGGVVALLLAVAGFERVKALDKTAEAQEKGNFEERYKNATQQLSQDDSSRRLAGIYSLYALAKNNESYSRIVCDTLCGYVRERTTSIVSVKVISYGKNETENRWYKDMYNSKPSNEVQVVLDLLTKERDEQLPFESFWIDLSTSNLKHARLENAYLEDADLSGSHLEDADLSGSHLKDADLREAELGRADLREAELGYADLREAELEGADLRYAQLKNANLFEVHLEGANLWKAQLKSALLLRAHLEGAYLGRAHLAGADLQGAYLEGAYLGRAHLAGADLQRACLEGVCLLGSYFGDAELNGANFEGAYELEEDSDVIKAGTALDMGIERLKWRKEKTTELNTIVLPEEAIVGIFTEEKANEIITRLEKIRSELYPDENKT